MDVIDVSAMNDDELIETYTKQTAAYVVRVLFNTHTEEDLMVYKLYIKYLLNMLEIRGIDERAIDEANRFFEDIMSKGQDEDEKEEKQN